jgi:hypothetical protein
MSQMCVRPSALLPLVFRLALPVMGMSALALAGCGGSNDRPPGGDAGGDGTVRRGQMLVTAMSDQRGVVRVAGSAGDVSDILVIDGETQKPIAGALAEALGEDDGAGYLIRLSKEDGGYRPETVRCKRGQPRTVVMGAATPDVRGRAVRVASRVDDDEFVGELDLPGLLDLSQREGRSEIVFLPAFDEQAMRAGARFAVYQSPLPKTLLALHITDKRPASGTVVRGQARVVSTAGARRAGARVQPVQVTTAGEKRAGEDQAAPAVTSLSVSAPDATGATKVVWGVEDPGNRLLGFDVGLDTTAPTRRLGKDARTLDVNVRQGDHLACVRPVFAGADVDPELRCVSFAAPLAPPAPNVRVAAKAGSPAQAGGARRGMPVAVEVEVSNDGAHDAPGFFVDVVLSRDGRLEGGLGEVRSIWVDGVKAGGKAVRTTQITPSRDGQLFVVARADGARVLGEANAEDNFDRLPLGVAPAGTNRSPLLSLAGTTLGGPVTVLAGEAIKLRASADDSEDGDLSAGITWWSSRDGKIGTGPTPSLGGLSPGMHRIRAEVSDRGLPAAALPRGPRGGELQYATAEPPDTVTAEIELQVVAPSAPASNSAPRVSAGPDLTSTVGTEVSPLAVASDADGDTLTFSWSATMVAGGAAVPLVDGDKLRPRFNPEVAGAYQLTVNVSDGKSSETDTAVVTVLSAAANRPPRVAVTLPGAATTGMVVRAMVDAADDDGDGLTLSYGLTRPPGSGALVMDGATRTPGFVPDLPGDYVLTAVVDDGRGGTAEHSASVTVTGPVVPADGGASGGAGGSAGTGGAGGSGGASGGAGGSGGASGSGGVSGSGGTGTGGVGGDRDADGTAGSGTRVDAGGGTGGTPSTGGAGGSSSGTLDLGGTVDDDAGAPDAGEPPDGPVDMFIDAPVLDALAAVDVPRRMTRPRFG